VVLSVANGEIDLRPPFGVSVFSSTNRFCERDWLSVLQGLLYS